MLGKISFSISIDTPAHAAFGDTPEEAILEIVRSVSELMLNVENTDTYGNSDINYSYCLKDFNGNTIGKSYLDIEYEDPEEPKEESFEEDDEEWSLDKVAQLILKVAQLILKKDGDCCDVPVCTYCPMRNISCILIDRVEFLNSAGYHLVSEEEEEDEEYEANENW